MSELALETAVSYLREQAQILANCKRITVMRAVSLPCLNLFKTKELLCFQTFKGDFDRLKEHGYVAEETMPQSNDLCLCLGTKQKDENLAMFAAGIDSLKRNGFFICALSNDLGAQRFEKELRKLGVEVFSHVKNRCRVFGVKKIDTVSAQQLEIWRKLGQPQLVAGTDLLSCPGVFAWAKIDRGSQVLTDCLPTTLEGKGADLGSGYGYLSHFLLSKNSGISEISLVEAERLGLQASMHNLEAFSKVRVNYLWLDVTTGLPLRDLDWIVTNPPFHSGRSVRMSLGSRFVIEAAKALKIGGVFYMVANKHLPYEPLLTKHFTSFDLLKDSQGFKVFRAYK